MAQQECPLPDYGQQKCEDYLGCGRLEHGFLRVRCDIWHAEHLVACSCKQCGVCPNCGAQLLAHSITYCIAVGPQAGRKVFTLQTLPATEEPFDDPMGQVAAFSFGTSLSLIPSGQPLAVQNGSSADWSLHASIAAKAHQCQALKRVCRCINRRAVSEQRLSLTPHGIARYQLKTPYRDGTPLSSSGRSTSSP